MQRHFTITAGNGDKIRWELGGRCKKSMPCKGHRIEECLKGKDKWTQIGGSGWAAGKWLGSRDCKGQNWGHFEYMKNKV